MSYASLGFDASASFSTSGGTSASGGSVPQVNVATTTKIQSPTPTPDNSPFIQFETPFVQQQTPFIQPAPTIQGRTMPRAPSPLTRGYQPVPTMPAPLQAGIRSPWLWAAGAAVVGLGLLWVIKRR